MSAYERGVAWARANRALIIGGIIVILLLCCVLPIFVLVLPTLLALGGGLFGSLLGLRPGTSTGLHFLSVANILAAVLAVVVSSAIGRWLLGSLPPIVRWIIVVLLTIVFYFLLVAFLLRVWPASGNSLLKEPALTGNGAAQTTSAPSINIDANPALGRPWETGKQGDAQRATFKAPAGYTLVVSGYEVKNHTDDGGDNAPWVKGVLKTFRGPITKDLELIDGAVRTVPNDQVEAALCTKWAESLRLGEDMSNYQEPAGNCGLTTTPSNTPQPSGTRAPSGSGNNDNTVNGKERRISGSGTITFQAGEAVSGTVKYDGEKDSHFLGGSCYVIAPRNGVLTDGVVNPWKDEIRNGQCR